MKKITGVLALVLGLSCVLAFAQSSYPEKPIRILVGFSAGVAPDITSRLFGDKWSETWAKGVAVDNVTGAGGNLAVSQVATTGARLASSRLPARSIRRRAVTPRSLFG